MSELIDCSRNVDSWVLVADKVDVWSWQVLTDEEPSGVAGLVMPAKSVVVLVVQKGHASLVAPAVGLQSSVRLATFI